MTNPARELLGILRDWEPSESKKIATVRGVDGEGAADGWRCHVTAACLVAEIDRVISGIGALDIIDVEPYLRQIPALCRSIFAPDIPWTGAPNAAQKHMAWLTQYQIDSLEMLASFLDSYKLYEDLDEKTVADLLELLDEVEELTLELSEIPDKERAFVMGLIREAQSVLKDVDTIGASSPRAVVFELAGRLTAVVPQASGENRDRLIDKLGRMFRAVGIRAGQKAIDIGTEEVLKALPPGS